MLFAALATGNASAVVITTSTMQLGPTPPMGSGGTFQTEYTVTNGPTDVPVEEFSIFYEFDLYSNLMVVSSPAGWDSFVDEPDPGVPVGGLYDTLALTATPLSPGDTLGGFVVSYDFLGSGSPGAQSFEIINPDDFSTIFAGTTTLAASAIPEPGTVALMGIGFLGLALGRRRRVMSVGLA